MGKHQDLHLTALCVYFENFPQMSHRPHHAPFLLRSVGFCVLHSLFFVLAISKDPSTAGIILSYLTPVCTTAEKSTLENLQA